MMICLTSVILKLARTANTNKELNTMNGYGFYISAIKGDKHAKLWAIKLQMP